MMHARFLTPRSIVPLATIAILLIGVGDVVTAVELPFTLLYLAPIALATWLRGVRIGLALACLATGCVFVALANDDYATLPFLWNAVGSLLMFLMTVPVADRLRQAFEREQAERRLAVDQLRHADRLNVIGTLSAGVAHELGTPLNVISGCAEMIQEISADDQVRGHTRLILAQTKKISMIVRQLLDFGRRRSVERTTVDLAEVVIATTAMLRSTAHKRGSKIEVSAGESLLTTGCAPELEQVLSNLILNALQAMDRGGVIQVQARVERRVAASGEEARHACVVVEDHGRGIAAEDLPRIFDPFFTTKGVGEGTGLGLSVSYGIIRDHGGSIEVDSKPNRGTRFSVLLPLAPGTREPRTQPAGRGAEERAQSSLAGRAGEERAQSLGGRGPEERAQLSVAGRGGEEREAGRGVEERAAQVSSAGRGEDRASSVEPRSAQRSSMR